MSDNNKIIVNMRGDVANQHMSMKMFVGSPRALYKIYPISDDIKKYWHLPKSYRTGLFYKEIKSEFVDELNFVDTLINTDMYSDSIHSTEWISFEFDNEEEALYFKLKYCS